MRTAPALARMGSRAPPARETRGRSKKKDPKEASSSIADGSPAAAAAAAAATPSTRSGTRRAAAGGAPKAGASTITRKKRKVSADTEAGNSSNSTLTPPARSSKKPKQSTAKKETPEKRLARFVSAPSTATNERITRAFEHRLYLIDKKIVGHPQSPSACDFHVLGSTGNVYKVKLEQKPSCTCPDFPRSRLCKHILFVMLRVLKLSRNDPRIWQKALLTSELKELLEISAVTDGVLASQSVRQRFKEIESGSSGKLQEGTNVVQPVETKSVQREISGDCPICYEKMDDGKGKAKEPVVFCRVCGNNVHRDCFQKWSSSKSSSGSEPTCIYCRAPWSDGPDTKNKNKIFFGQNYVNLADVSRP